MKKRGQINQVFVWIVIALVIGATALFGVQSIGGLLNDKCSIDLIKFEEDIRERTTLNNDFGSVHQEIFGAPCDYSYVCLVDARAIVDSQSQGNTDVSYLNQDNLADQPQSIQPFLNLIDSSVSDGVPENIFLFNDNELLPAGYVQQIRISETLASARSSALPNSEYNISCIQARSGRYNLIMEGLGRNTWVQSEEQYNER